MSLSYKVFNYFKIKASLSILFIFVILVSFKEDNTVSDLSKIGFKIMKNIKNHTSSLIKPKLLNNGFVMQNKSMKIIYFVTQHDKKNIGNKKIEIGANYFRDSKFSILFSKIHCYYQLFHLI